MMHDATCVAHTFGSSPASVAPPRQEFNIWVAPNAHPGRDNTDFNASEAWPGTYIADDFSQYRMHLY
jgi:hypothetical protein